jgi:hypothetical protein
MRKAFLPFFVFAPTPTECAEASRNLRFPRPDSLQKRFDRHFNMPFKLLIVGSNPSLFFQKLEQKKTKKKARIKELHITFLHT